MRCQHCQTRDAITQDGVAVTCHLFGEIEGVFCQVCLLELQRPYEVALRQSIRTQLPALTDEDLARVPDQMLKFTLCLPLPPEPSAAPAPRSAPPSPESR